MRSFLLPIVAVGWLCAGSARAAALEPRLELAPGDHVALMGNALADRMQHDGWFETYLHAAHPRHRLVVRNLAVAGDEVATRHRSENFGTPDEWLTRVQADVILAFFGFNESFRGVEGLAQFKADLGRFIEQTRAGNYSGKGAPRLVLFSPVAAERHRDPNYPDPEPINARLTLYTAAMAEVAQAAGVPFVDLYAPSARQYAAAAERGASLTINGVHLGPAGQEAMARVIFQELFARSVPEGDLSGLRAAVNRKNREWHLRYRTVDGFNVYGGRSRLSYESGKGGPQISNFQVMQEEMTQRDVLTGNQDRRVWATSSGGAVQVPDLELPSVTPVKSNKPGPGPEGAHVFLEGEAAIAKMKVHSGMTVNLYADERRFPELANPVQMAWDTRGRLWVAAWPNYPGRTPDSTRGDRLLVFEDLDRDGRADRCTPFLDDLNAPTGFQFYRDGVILVQAPDVWFVRDTDGDGRADTYERVLMGLDSADSHHTANALCLDPGGAIYLSDGVFHRTQVETAAGPVRNNDAAIYRFEPRTGRFETYVPYGFANPHGRVFDRWGNDLITDATGNNTYFGPAISGYLDYPAKHPGLKEFWSRPSRPCPGTGLLSSRHFPDEFQGNFLNCNVIGFQGIFRVKVSEDGSGLQGETLEHLVSSEDPNFRPSAVSVGPDGALYFLDWHNPIIGHMQHHLRDPSRDHAHGRIYRITYGGRPLLDPPPIAGAPIPALLELLKAPEDNTRERAKIELGGRDTRAVIDALTAWIAALDPRHPDYEHHLTEALWVHQWHNAVDAGLLANRLKSPEPRARAAAARVLCYWRDRVPEALSWFKTLARDRHPRVRLEAIRAASFYRTADAADVALAALEHPTDYYLDYVLRETMRQLEPWWRRAIAEGKPLAADNPAGLEYLLRSLSPVEVQKLPRTAAVLGVLLARPDLTDADRGIALEELAQLGGRDRATTLLDQLERLCQRDRPAAGRLARLLPWLPASELRPARAGLVASTGSRGCAEVRPAAWAALTVADGSFDASWTLAGGTAATLNDWLSGIPLLNDPEFRAQAYDRVLGILKGEAEAGVRTAAIRALVSMGARSEDTFLALAGLVAQGQEVPAAARGLRGLPRDGWPREAVGSVATNLVAWARQVPVSGRTAQDYLEAVQLAGDLAGVLPAESASALRRELRELRVAVFVLRTVREQMRYDTPRLVVEAGKPFEIILENDDFMPHNLVIVTPGARETIGTITETMRPDQLDGQGRPYVPNRSEILAATKLLEPGLRTTLQLTAPTNEGEHEYVCTFPGHWRTMWGQLVVTRDVEAYLAAHPEPTVVSSGGLGHEHGHGHGHGASSDASGY